MSYDGEFLADRWWLLDGGEGVGAQACECNWRKQSVPSSPV